MVHDPVVHDGEVLPPLSVLLCILLFILLYHFRNLFCRAQCVNASSFRIYKVEVCLICFAIPKPIPDETMV